MARTKEENRKYMKEYYKNHPEYQEYTKKNARERYQRKKAERENKG
jgi:hypothetical protein